MTAARQLGNGARGGTEALAIFHQLIYDEWMAGGLSVPLVRIKVDEKNCFGRLEWAAIREASRRSLPRHAAVACWKHGATSFVEQEGDDPTPQDRGAEQGDVDGPLECSLVLATVACETRTKVAGLQRNGVLPWVSDSTDAASDACDDNDRRDDRAQAFAAKGISGEEVRIDPRHDVQINGGLVDF